MSYILDALRKADAQRERDPARGIHAQPLRAAAGQPRPRGAYGPGLWAAAAAGLAALVLAGWYVYRDRGGSAPAPQQRVEIAARTPDAGAPLARTQTAPVVGNGAATPPGAAPVPVQAAAPALVTVPAPAPAIEPPAPAGQPFTTPAGTSRITSLPMMRGGPQASTAPAPAVPGAPLEAPVAQSQRAGAPAPLASAPAGFSPQLGAPAAPTPTTARGMAATPMAAPAASPPTALPRTPAISAPVPAAPPTPPVAGLPADAPKLVLSGGVYSLNPAQRMLIVNGQVFNEGSEVGPGVVLEEIKARTVVLRFRGSRYTVSY